jgi:hypothetical protein
MLFIYLPLLLSAAAFIVAVFSFFHFKSYLKRRTGQERILAEMREEVNRILNTINETTDRDISLIEEREKNLKNLLAQTQACLADIEKRIKVYIKEMDVRRESEAAYAALSSLPGREPVPSQSGGDKTARGGGSNQKITLSYQELEKFRRVIAKPAPGPEGAKPEAEHKALPDEEKPSVNEQIRSLVKEGIPPAIIAARLGISIAEAEFATALLERREM